MHGILVIDKPKGYTSRDVVNIVSKKLHTKKVGHTGTLDPLATGVLVLCVGDYTKLVSHLTNHEKEYIATIRFGIETDTLDITGQVLKESDVIPSREKLEAVLETFLGCQPQEVPIYSAKKIKGKKLYEYARNQEEVTLPIQNIEVKELELLSFQGKEAVIRAVVSKGTYIRSLIRDIGEKLGSPCIMSNLQRTRQGCFTLEKAKNVQELIEHDIISLKDAMEDYPRITITEEAIIKKIKNGCKLPNCIEKMTCLLDKEENLLAIYTPVGEMMKPLKVFHEG